ncbi:MAG: hydrogenase maturation nickel metallochaperone HypA [Bryobacteraceae bacterium]|nr:hydrogenase maturation nickel metallochaperone HypA [Bryobacteraceae bacterium]
MHELSIAHALVETAVASLPPAGVARVLSVHVRLGALSGVVRQALEFCYGMATENTPLAGSTLLVEEVPALAFCPECCADREVGAALALSCPVCGALCKGLTSGKDLDLLSLEIELLETPADGGA